MKKLIIALVAMVAISASAQNNNSWRSNNHHDDAYGVVNGGHRGHDDRVMVAPASKDEAEMVIKLVKKTSFDDNKLEVAKVCLALRPMFASDIEAIARCFSFDDGRLQFLKYAYPYCVDKENAINFGRVFSFKSNSDKLYEFIQKYNKKHNSHRR